MRWLKNASIGLKVSLAPVIGVVCLAFMGAVGWYANVSLGNTLSVLAEDRLPRVIRFNHLHIDLVGLNTLISRSLTWEGAGYKADKIAVLDKKVAAELDRVGKQLVELGADPSLDEVEREAARQLGAEYAKFRKFAGEVLDVKSGMLTNAAGFMTNVEDSYAAMTLSFNQLVDHEKALAVDAAAGGRGLASRNNRFIVVSLVGAALLAAACAWLAVGMIVRPLRLAVQTAMAMSKGDFSAVPSSGSRDATGRVLHALAEVSGNLGQIVRDIRASADEVSVASQQIAHGNVDLSHRTETTVAALQRTAASLEQLTAAIRQSADNAAEANGMARQASEVAAEGGVAVAEVVTTMQQIDAQAKKIREIVGVIDGLAFQTNILALNAAVEAARAGEHGRGFAVVAQEVRGLAQSCAASAKEIRVLIGASVGQVESGTSKVLAAGATMQRIVEAIQKVSATVDAISRAAAEQAGSVADVNSAVAEMERDTQQNAALVEQATAATEALKDQARQLADSVGTLRTA
ncbi:MAG: methyl-accepting chemotaxis protein [Burkholderiales bacterium]|nr:methyl-accepting chemotaxis protein [Burkholderiales bacterium]